MKSYTQQVKATLTFIILLAALGAGSVLAQQSDEPSFEETQEAEAAVESSTQSAVVSTDADEPDEQQDEASSGSQADDGASQPEVNPDASFTPTEEISEDKPVAFPVDI